MAAPAANGAKVHGVKVISAVPDLHLMSWNVAGWKTTSEHIRRFKGGLAAFLERHHVDVLCIQEVKLSAKVLAADALKLGADIPGFESFWACNEGQGAQRQGLNGVATFVRQGLVVRADSQPLNDSELDSEGRCLMTDHGTFVVFNVYVPNSAGGMRLPFKMRFLSALRAAMASARKAGKAVILAGDLNMKARAVDSHWMMRPLEVPRLRGLVARGPEPRGPAISADASVAVDAISASWPSVAAALRAKEHRPFETKNSRTGQTFQRWGVYAKARSGEVIRIGPPHDVEDCARASFLVDGVAIERDCEVVLGAGYADATFLLQRPGVLSAADLGECMKKLEGVEVGPAALKSISDAFGDVGTPPAVRDWLQSVLLKMAWLTVSQHSILTQRSASPAGINTRTSGTRTWAHASTTSLSTRPFSRAMRVRVQDWTHMEGSLTRHQLPWQRQHLMGFRSHPPSQAEVCPLFMKMSSLHSSGKSRPLE